MFMTAFWKRLSGDAKLQQWLIFGITILLYMIWLLPQESMIISSADACDNWQSIITWFSSERYGSYTLYKGFAAVYPYVFLYHMAIALHLNEFFFCMLYFAVLFAYVTAIGVPLIAEYLTGWTPKLLQRIIVPVFFFLIWKPTMVMNSLTVDLPSCAFFVMATTCILTISERQGRRQWLFVLLSGLLTSLCANISGQYSVSALFLLILAVVQILRSTVNVKQKMQHHRILQIILLFVSVAAVKLLNIMFMTKAVAPLVSAGAWIPSGDMWLQRGLLYFINRNRYLYGIPLMNPRGFAILQDMHGSEEAASNLLEMASMGTMGWSVSEYFNMVFHYPVDAVVQALDKFFLSFSIDMRRQSVAFLVTGYSLFYIAAWNAVRRIHRWRDLLSPKILIVLAALCSLIPTMVMTLEMRVAIGAQSIIFGTALLCGSIPQTLESVAYRLSRGRIGKQRESVSLSVYLTWCIFILFCMMHMGTLYAQSDMGTEMLFKWW